jgi:hypothetical protein
VHVSRLPVHARRIDDVPDALGRLYGAFVAATVAATLERSVVLPFAQSLAGQCVGCYTLMVAGPLLAAYATGVRVAYLWLGES